MGKSFKTIERPLQVDEIEKLLLEAQNLEQTLRRVSDLSAFTQETNTRLGQLCSYIRSHIEELVEQLEANEDGAAALAEQAAWDDLRGDE